MAHERYTSELTTSEVERIMQSALESYICHENLNRAELQRIAHQLRRIADWTQELTEVLKEAGRGG